MFFQFFLYHLPFMNLHPQHSAALFRSIKVHYNETSYIFILYKSKLGSTKLLKGDLRPKLHLWFYYLYLLILWRKNFTQRFLVFWPVLTKLWTSKVLNLMQVTSYPRMHKTFHPRSSFHIFVHFTENKLSTKLFGFFDHFSKLKSFEWLNCVSKLVTSLTKMNVRNMLIVPYM